MWRIKDVLKRIKHMRMRYLIAGVLVFVIAAGLGLTVLQQNRAALIHSPIVREVLPVYRVLKSAHKKAVNMLYIPRMRTDTSALNNYELIIDREDIQELNDNLPDSRSEEVIDGRVWLSDAQKETVPAVFRYEDREFDVKVRYRGDNPSHWLNEKKSWQIIFPKDNLFDGKRVLKLILPSDRLYFVEALNNYRAEKLGLHFPESEFVFLTINGERMGVYYGIEDWSNDYLERAQLPADANIYKTEDIFIQNNDLKNRGGSIFDLTRYWDQEAGDGRYAYRNYAELDTLLDMINANELTEHAESIVDLESFYAWQTLAILAGSIHASDEGNVRLVFNNTSGKFEFIPWDTALDSYTIEEVTAASELVRQVLADPKRMHILQQRVWNYIDEKKNLKDDFAFYDELYETYRGLFYADMKKVHNSRVFDQEVAAKRALLEANIDALKQTFGAENARLHVVHDDMTHVVTVTHYVDTVGGLRIKRMSIPASAGTEGSLFIDSNNNGTKDAGDTLIAVGAAVDGVLEFSPDGAYLLPQSTHRDAVTGESTHHVFMTYTDGTVDLDGFDGAWRHAVTNKKVKIDDIYRSNDTTFQHADALLVTPEEFVAEQSVFVLRDDILVLPSGSYTFDSTVIIPAGTRVRIEPGVVMRMAAGVSVLSYSPVDFAGTAARPIVLTAASEMPWGVFGVVGGNGATTTVSYTTVEKGSEAYINGVYLSGMFSLYHTDVTARHLTVQHARGEDGLNIKYGLIDVRDSLFTGNASDAFDADFTTGVVRNNAFTGNGNDSLDTSGSQLVVMDNTITNSGDKCISLGERTKNTLLFNNSLDSCLIGVQIKDGSDILLVNNYIAKNAIGVDAYQKKDMYKKGGTGYVHHTILAGNELPHQADDASSITVDDASVAVVEVVSTPPIQCDDESVHVSDALRDALKKDFGDTLMQQGIDISQFDTLPIGLYTCT